MNCPREQQVKQVPRSQVHIREKAFAFFFFFKYMDNMNLYHLYDLYISNNHIHKLQELGKASSQIIAIAAITLRKKVMNRSCSFNEMSP